MDYKKVIESIEEKIYDQGSKMTDDEATILKANIDNADAMCYYALGLLMNSSCRFHYLSGFKNYDEMQEEAFKLLDKAMEKESANAYYWMAEIKTGLLGKFPMNIDGAKELYEKYYRYTQDRITKKKVLDNWDEFLTERNKRFDNLKFIEIYQSINPNNVNTSGHDEAYYESLSDEEEKN